MAPGSQRPKARAASLASAPVPQAQLHDWGANLASALLVGGVLGSAWLFDPLAEASFDAPKRLAVLVAVGLATVACLVLRPRHETPVLAWTPTQRGLAACAGVALGWALLAGLAAPAAGAAWQALPPLLLQALALPLGASRVCAGARGRWLLLALVSAGVLNALVVVGQALGVWQPYAVEQLGGRANLGALIGNEGALAQLLALIGAALLPVALSRARPSWRLATALLVLLLVGAIVVCRNLTALATLLVAAAGLALLRLRRHRLLTVACAALAGTVLMGLHAPLALRLYELGRDAAAADYNRVLSNRLAPWAAALEMARTRPWLGHGPGRFGALYAPHRMQAEVRLRQRVFVPGHRQTSYAQAHQEYLQVAAEAGWPAAVLVLLAVGWLLSALLVRLRAHPEHLELAVLTSLLLAVAVSALVWFPMQAPASALPALLAVGRAWRLLGATALATPAAAAPVWRPLARDPLARGLAVALVLVALWPQVGRYAGERHLRRAVVALLSASALPADARPALLAQAVAEAHQAVRLLPYDHRPWLAAGSSHLLGRQAEAARQACRYALECEERPEILLNLGRAYAVLDRRPEALAAFVRAVWFNPEFLSELPLAARPLVVQRIGKGEGLLRAGHLWGPPPLPGAPPLTGPPEWLR